MSVVDGLRELEAAATPGRWGINTGYESWGIQGYDDDQPIVMAGCTPQPTVDGELICAMRNALPALLDVVEAAEARQAVRGPLGETLKERAAAETRLEEALAALESAQGAEQRPETGAGA